MLGCLQPPMDGGCPGCGAALGGPWDSTRALGQRQSVGGEPGVEEGPGGQAPTGSLVACGQTPAPRVLICKLTLLTVTPPFLALVSPSMSGHSSLMQPSGLVSAADPALAESLPCLPEQPELGHADPTAGKTASGEPPRCLTIFLGAARGSQQQVRVSHSPRRRPDDGIFWVTFLQLQGHPWWHSGSWAEPSGPVGGKGELWREGGFYS